VAKVRQRIPVIGDLVIPPGTTDVYNVIDVSNDGTEVLLQLGDTDKERFRVLVDKLTWVSR
jgi:hypothetical protein